MKLLRGRFRTRKALKQTLGKSGLRNTGGVYSKRIVTDQFGNRYWGTIAKRYLISAGPLR